MAELSPWGMAASHSPTPNRVCVFSNGRPQIVEMEDTPAELSIGGVSFKLTRIPTGNGELPIYSTAPLSPSNCAEAIRAFADDDRRRARARRIDNGE